jgi:2-oxoglutarate dehydrogenase E2 component (dihydrolipoamide succinyltransferase)
MMSIEIKAPTFPESIADGSIATWHKKVGEAVSRDEPLVDIETDKVVLEVVAPADGVLTEILKPEGDTVLSDEVVARFEEGASASAAPVAEKAEAAVPAAVDLKVSPAARKMLEEKGIDAAAVTGTGKGGVITKEDVVNHKPAATPVASAATPKAAAPAAAVVDVPAGERVEKRVPMTRLRKRIAERLLEATHTTAMLTTFNEVNMKPVMDLRSQYKDLFEKSHNGTRLGFMGFFVKAACESLKRFPAVNASIDGDDVVYHGYQDVGVAVSTEKGLVVPVLRDAENMSMAKIEEKIREYGLRAKDGKLSMEDMTGGTFTITNGGVFGSLLSTPILNPPQTAILGMHKIQDRPMAVNGEVVIQPMMYLALSYDHRLVDGKDAVQFLVTIKDLIEDPARILLEV